MDEHAHDGAIVGKDQLQLLALGGNALGVIDQRIALGTLAGVAAWRVGAQLIAVTPLRALVQIDAGAIIGGKTLSLAAVADAAGERGAALELAAQRRTGGNGCKEEEEG